MTAAFVLDASAALACASPDQAPSPALRAAVVNRAIEVPALWPFEVQNALTVLRRRGRLDDGAYDMAQTLIEAMRVTVEPPDRAVVRTRTADLADAHGLSVYDAAYLELASRRRLPLATLDANLRKAAKAARVALVE